VWLARERELGRLVALKLLREGCPAFQQRLRHEARVMARLAHPAIVPVYAFEGGERPCIVMQYMAGGSLALARHEPRALVRTLRGVVDALAFAHEHGIVHRDVKPENVLLEREGEARIGDFGLALEPRDHAGRTHLPVAGTLLAMSPEQVRGERVGPPSDQFSLGVTLYRQLTGEWPFRGRSVADVIAAIEREAPVPPRVLAGAVPRPLERIVLRCLAKDPARRFASMRELGAELDRFLARRVRLTRWLALVRARWTPLVAPAPRDKRLHPPSTPSLLTHEDLP
jgi:serine/threonine-protein kinase